MLRDPWGLPAQPVNPCPAAGACPGSQQIRAASRGDGAAALPQRGESTLATLRAQLRGPGATEPDERHKNKINFCFKRQKYIPSWAWVAKSLGSKQRERKSGKGDGVCVGEALEQHCIPTFPGGTSRRALVLPPALSQHGTSPGHGRGALQPL